MFFLILVLIGIVSLLIAAVRREPLIVIVSTRFVWLPLLLVGIVLRFVFLSDRLSDIMATTPVPGWWALGSILFVISLLALVAFTWRNRHVPGLALILIGLTFNLLVITLNGGRMPGDPEVLAQAGWLELTLKEQQSGEWSIFGIITESSPLPWLGDRFLVPIPFRQPIVLSVGDFIIGFGAICFFNQIPLVPARWRTRLSASESKPLAAE